MKENSVENGYTIEDIEAVIRERPIFAKLIKDIIAQPEGKKQQVINDSVWILNNVDELKKELDFPIPEFFDTEGREGAILAFAQVVKECGGMNDEIWCAIKSLDMCEYLPVIMQASLGRYDADDMEY